MGKLTINDHFQSLLFVYQRVCLKKDGDPMLRQSQQGAAYDERVDVS